MSKLLSTGRSRLFTFPYLDISIASLDYFKNVVTLGFRVKERKKKKKSRA